MSSGLWHVLDIQGEGEAPPGLAGMYAGRDVLIIGCGRTVWQDLLEWPRYQHGPMRKPYDASQPEIDIMAINEIGLYLPHVDHWVSMHDDVLRHLSEIRKRLALAETMLHSDRPVGKDTHCYCCGGIVYLRFVANMLNSGLLAVHIALLLGYDEILLAGIPADNEGNFYHPPGVKGIHGVNRARERWEMALQRIPAIAARVRSLSGWTRERLGSPESLSVGSL